MRLSVNRYENYEKTPAPVDRGARVGLVLAVCRAVRLHALAHCTGQFVRIKIERQLVPLARDERNHPLLV